MITKTVAEVMTPNPTVVQPADSLQKAIALLVEKRISALPVVDQQGTLTGIISNGDLTWQETGVDTPPYIMVLDSVIYLQNPTKHNTEIHKALGQTVGELMSKHVHTVRPNQMVREAAHLMHEKQVDRLPVVAQDSPKVVGIITQGDIIRAMAQTA